MIDDKWHEIQEYITHVTLTFDYYQKTNTYFNPSFLVFFYFSSSSWSQKQLYPAKRKTNQVLYCLNFYVVE